MKNMMFNDRYVLTDAVLNGSKTNTRREEFSTDANLAGECSFTKKGLIYKRFDFDNGQSFTARYAIGEVVAVAQCYADIYGEDGALVFGGKSAGDFNKMFVRADLMPHHIRITNIRIERLQDISEDDCLNEGIKEHVIMEQPKGCVYSYYGNNDRFDTPREAFAALIDKVSGRGTWNRNPWVIVYEFEKVD